MTTWRNRIIGEGEEALDPGASNLCLGFAVAAPTQRGQVAEVIGRRVVAIEKAERLDVVDMEMPRVLGGGATVLADTTVTLQCGASGAPPSWSVDPVSSSAAGIGAVPLSADPLGKAILRAERSICDLPRCGRREQGDRLATHSARHVDAGTLPDLGATRTRNRAEDPRPHLLRPLHLKLDAALFASKHAHGILGPLILCVLPAAVHIVRPEPIKSPAMNADRCMAVGAPSVKHVVGALESWLGLVVANVRRVWMKDHPAAPAQACLLYLVHLLIIGGLA